MSNSDPEPVVNIAKLYATDPLKLTSENITAIVEDWRSRRLNFAKTAGKKPKAPAKTKAETKGAATASKLGIKLDGLSL